MCHVGFAVEGRPWVVPMLHGRRDDVLYLHGAVGNHLLRTLAAGVEMCATVTLIDGLVLARSAFHHSVNYRSVMVFGTGRLVDDVEERAAALDVLVDHVLPGRAAQARPGSRRELDLRAVVALPVTEASAKVRSGGPNDDEDHRGADRRHGRRTGSAPGACGRRSSARAPNRLTVACWRWLPDARRWWPGHGTVVAMPVVPTGPSPCGAS